MTERTTPNQGVLPAMLQVIGKGFQAFIEFSLAAIETYDGLPLNVRYVFKKQIIDAFSKSMPNQVWDEFFRDDMELARILVEYGWWVLERDFTGPMQRELLRLGREKNRKGIDRYLVGIFSESNCFRIEAKINAWFELPYLAKRQHIVTDCLWAHRQRRYSLTVPCLMPMIDGLFRVFDKVWPSHLNQKKSVIKSATFANAYRQGEQDFWGAPFTQRIGEMFQGFDFGTGTPGSTLNRHAILHGESADYGIESNSIKLFLAIDTIQSFIRAMQASMEQSVNSSLTFSLQQPTPKRGTTQVPGLKRKRHYRRRGPKRKSG